jgi:predicted fused transcriptional regulator/phosphomethylpyrimidine kinase/predicted transcriptional regulator
MRPPCENVVRQFLPLLRALVSKDLMTRYGWTQNQIATRLGVTQPAISSYISFLERKDLEGFNLEELSQVAGEIASGYTNNEISLSDSILKVCQLCIKLKSGGSICTQHKLAVTELGSERCEACKELFSGAPRYVEERYNVLQDLKEAIVLLESSDSFASVIPEVRTNVVMALPKAKSVSQVAAIPGRIVEIRGKAKAFEEPEFGSSYHLAKMLLITMQYNMNYRSALNIKYNEEIGKAIEIMGCGSYVFNRSEFPDEVMESEVPATWGVKLAHQNRGSVPDVLIDEGGYGIEPATYVFGLTSVDAVSKALKIADAAHNQTI